MSDTQDIEKKQEIVVTEAMVDAFFGVWVEWSGQGDNFEDMELGVTPDLRGLLETVSKFLACQPRPLQAVVTAHV